MRNPFALLALGLCLMGCSNYVVPMRAADMRETFGVGREALTDPAVQARLDVQPLAQFPTGIAVVRVQCSGYRSYSSEGYGRGRYSVLTMREAETDESLAKLTGLPMISGIAGINRLLLPENLQSDVELRQAAAMLHADMLLIYTLDTTFRTDDFAPPLSVVTLGLSPSKQAKVTCTASAALFDTRSGYLYAVCEATAKDDQLANAWTSNQAIDQTRLRTERRAFAKLVDEFAKTWPHVVTRYHKARG